MNWNLILAIVLLVNNTVVLFKSAKRFIKYMCRQYSGVDSVKPFAQYIYSLSTNTDILTPHVNIPQVSRTLQVFDVNKQACVLLWGNGTWDRPLRTMQVNLMASIETTSNRRNYSLHHEPKLF